VKKKREDEGRNGEETQSEASENEGRNEMKEKIHGRRWR
jgi:hypothetical protein